MSHLYIRHYLPVYRRKFLVCCSWGGGSRCLEGEEPVKKVAFKAFQHTIKLFFACILQCSTSYSLDQAVMFLKAQLKNATQKSKANLSRKGSYRPKRKKRSVKRNPSKHPSGSSQKNAVSTAGSLEMNQIVTVEMNQTVPVEMNQAVPDAGLPTTPEGGSAEHAGQILFTVPLGTPPGYYFYGDNNSLIPCTGAIEGKEVFRVVESAEADQDDDLTGSSSFDSNDESDDFEENYVDE